MSGPTKEQRADWHEQAVAWGPNADGLSEERLAHAVIVLLAELATAESVIKQLESEMRVEELHADGKDCPVCTHMEFEQVESLNNHLLDDIARVEAERDKAVAELAAHQAHWTDVFGGDPS